MIRLNNVRKHYAKNGAVIKALDDVSIEIPAGKLALVCGPSGSGKTTLINLAAGLARPSAGEITVAGERIDGLSPGARARIRAQKVAVVFQMFHLVPYLTALENVLLPTLAAPSEEPLARANALLDELGIADRAGHRPGELSAGERQRCAVARALLNRPQVILADEPTGNLDPESASHVLAMLGRCRAEGATVLLVSHQQVDAVHPDIEFKMKAGKIEA
jgi:ABC-type lipoprotein export system ATPase subunit